MREANAADDRAKQDRDLSWNPVGTLGMNGTTEQTYLQIRGPSF